MDRYKSVDNRDQMNLMPMCMDDMISPDSEVRAIDAIVDKMGIPSIGFTYSATKETGRKPYNPVDMFKLYAYSYFNGIRSSRKIEHYNKAVEQYLILLDSCDEQGNDSITPKLSRAKIEEKIEGINKRLAELEELKQQVKENGTIYKTDPDARMMKANNKGCDICHNVQIAVDDKNHLVVAVDVTSEPVDKKQFHSIALQAKKELGVESITAIADKGYYSASQFAKCKEDNIIPIVSKADNSFMAATKEYGKTEFRYDATQDGYICPQGHLLKAYHHRKEYTQETDVKRYQNYEACSHCPVREKCSNGKKGRTIQDRPFQRIADEVDKRTKQFADMYKIRKQTVEHPWGTIKIAFFSL